MSKTFEDLKKSELMDIANKAGLEVDGTKAEIIKVLVANDIRLATDEEVADLNEAIDHGLEPVEGELPSLAEVDAITEEEPVLMTAEQWAAQSGAKTGETIAQVCLGKRVLMEYKESQHGPNFREMAKKKAHERNLEVRYA